MHGLGQVIIGFESACFRNSDRNWSQKYHERQRNEFQESQSDCNERKFSTKSCSQIAMGYQTSCISSTKEGAAQPWWNMAWYVRLEKAKMAAARKQKFSRCISDDTLSFNAHSNRYAWKCIYCPGLGQLKSEHDESLLEITVSQTWQATTRMAVKYTLDARWSSISCRRRSTQRIEAAEGACPHARSSFIWRCSMWIVFCTFQIWWYQSETRTYVKNSFRHRSLARHQSVPPDPKVHKHHVLASLLPEYLQVFDLWKVMIWFDLLQLPRYRPWINPLRPRPWY